MKLFSRILMNVADGGSGNGATTTPPAAAPAAPPATPAQGDAPLTRKDLEAFAASLTTSVTKTVQDGVFANLRKAGVLTTKQPSTTAKPTTTDEVETPSSTPAAAHNPLKLREFDRALTRTGHANSISEANYKRYEKLFLEEDPHDAEAWVKEVLPAIGAATSAANVAAPPQNTTPPAPTGPTVSDRGAPAPGKTPPEEINLRTASKADREAVLKAKGPRWFTEKLRKDLTGVRVKLG